MAPSLSSDDSPPPEAGRELVLAVIGAHAGSLLAVARRHSLCADDAHDAYQRALEIFLRRAASVDPATAPAWLRTVVKHEAMAVRASRQRIVGPVAVDMDRTEARELLPAEDLVAAGERDARSTEALARLKPQEVRALVLKARGYSYREICEITGWTYTKVNRCLTEGRRAFLDRVADIEAGRECERWAGTLSALADGEASSGDLAAARPHLRHCPACRATLREFRRAPHAVAALAPLASPAADPGVLSRLHDAIAGGWHERVVLSAHRVQASVEAASAGKLAAVAASATALAGGGAAALTRAAPDPAGRPAAASAPAKPPAAAPRPVRRPAGSIPAASPRPARVARRRTGVGPAKPLSTGAAAEFGPGAAAAPAKTGAPSASSGAASPPPASPGAASPPPASPGAASPPPALAAPVPSRGPGPSTPSSSPSSSEFAP